MGAGGAGKTTRTLRALGSHLAAAGACAEEPAYTLAQVREHNSTESCWVAICGGVYDFTPFVDLHPGGARALLRHAGKDASDIFAELHSQSIFGEFGPKHRIGRLVHADGVSQDSKFWTKLTMAYSHVQKVPNFIPGAR
eukprot:SAG31_NODE_11229_length_1051_cov_1.790966_1_plen_139_part_00